MFREAVLLAGLALSLAPASSGAEAKGTFKMNGESVALNEAVSYSGRDGTILVVLSDKPLPKGYTVPVDEVQGLTLSLEDGEVVKVAVSHKALGDRSWSTTDTYSIEFTAKEQNETVISGRVLMTGEEIAFAGASLEALDVQFATEISTPEEIARGN